MNAFEKVNELDSCILYFSASLSRSLSLLQARCIGLYDATNCLLGAHNTE